MTMSSPFAEVARLTSRCTGVRDRSVLYLADRRVGQEGHLATSKVSARTPPPRSGTRRRGGKGGLGLCSGRPLDEVGLGRPRTPLRVP